MSKMIKRAIIVIPIVLIAGAVLVYNFLPQTVFILLRNMERNAAGLEQKHIEVGEWRITYLAGGRGEALVLLHGFGANKDNWRPVTRIC